VSHSQFLDVEKGERRDSRGDDGGRQRELAAGEESERERRADDLFGRFS